MVSLQFTPLLYIYSGSALITLIISGYSIHQYWTKSHVKTKLMLSFIAIVLGGFLWATFRMLELFFVDPTLTRLWIAMIYIGYGLSTVSTLIFGLAFAGRQEILTKRNVGLLFLLPMVAFILALTNDYYHSLLWTGEFIERSGWYGSNILFYDREFEALFYLYLIYTFSASVIGLYITMRVAVSSPDVYQRQMIIFSIGSISVLVAGTLFGLERQPLVPQFFDLTPVAFSVLALCFGYVLFRHELLNLVPIARDSVIDGMEDAYVVLDTNQRIVDSNPAARDLVEIDSDWIGIEASTFFQPFAEQYERFSDQRRVDTEVSINKNGRQRHFDLQISPIASDGGGEEGTLVVLREITELKEREQELQEREQELDLLRQVQSRVLRHNIRNDLGVVRTYGEVLSEQLESDQEEMAETVVDTTDDLLSVSNKARSVEQLVEQDQVPTSIDITATIENTINSYRDRFPDVVFSLDAPDKCTIETIPAMELAIENLIENAAEHSKCNEKIVDVEVEQTSDCVRVRISDNGPGIPDHELEVLEEGEETDLKHGSGVGLWLVDWVIRNSDASIEFDSLSDGSQVIITIPHKQ